MASLTHLSIIILSFICFISMAYSGDPIPSYTYKIVRAYNHDRQAFTQGLAFKGGELYEGTGLYGQSELRKVELESGKIIKNLKLSDHYFGEGITIFGNHIIQLTWKSHIGFVYDINNFQLIKTFTYPMEGWGITHDGKNLIISDGTSALHFINPETYNEIKQIQVKDTNGTVTNLNELEYIQGEIWANVWQTERIARISPSTGNVSGWIFLEGLSKMNDQRIPIDVLNGIGYDDGKNRLFVTGKLWPNLFEIKVLPKNRNK